MNVCPNDWNSIPACKCLSDYVYENQLHGTVTIS